MANRMTMAAMMSLFMGYLFLNMYSLMGAALPISAVSMHSTALPGAGKTARPQAAPCVPNDYKDRRNGSPSQGDCFRRIASNKMLPKERLKRDR
jgi:hypothetical protein